ncbi:hypothetical protein EDD86DRAFT_198408 [Gorgonomyces haynaldii]|nr:hypothetical protein EDD86DRAFT_198408 [Gorgonomyces haynaldii]
MIFTTAVLLYVQVTASGGLASDRLHIRAADCVSGTPVVAILTKTACPTPTDAAGRTVPSCSEKRSQGYYCYDSGFCCDKLGACFGCQGSQCQTKTVETTTTSFDPSCATTTTLTRGTPLPSVMPPIQANQNPVIYKGCVSKDMWALTFDDGPSPNIPPLLELLKSQNIKATFFVNGKNYADLETNEADKTNLKAIYDAGHQVASHTYQHADMATLQDDALWQQIYLNDKAVYSVIGVSPRHFRFPFLSHNARADDALTTWGFKIIDISVDTLDYEHVNTTDQASFFSLNDQSWKSTFVQANSQVSLNHDFVPLIVPYITSFIAEIKSLGYRFVRVDECIGDTKPYN